MPYRLWTRLLWTGIIACVAMPVLAAQPILNIQHWETSHGATVYFVRRPEIPMLDIQLAFAAGSAYDAKTWGLANFVNNMLDQGTKQHDANQIAAQFDALGAEFGGAVGRDMALVSLRSVSDSHYLQPALQLFEEVLTQINFPKRAFARVKQQTEISIQASQQQPMSVASNAFYKALYGHGPYAHPVVGTTKRVAQLTRSQAMDFYHRYYVARNASVMIVGDVTRAKAKQIAEDITKGLPTGEKAKALMPVADSAPSQKSILLPVKQNSIILGQVATTRDSPDYFPLMVGNQILGGGTMTSILFNEVRNERGLVYGVSSRFNLLRYRGPFSIVLQTRGEKAKEALGVTRDALNTFMKKGPTAEQLKAAQRNMIGAFPLQIAKNSQIESVLTRMAFYHLPMDYLDGYRDSVNAVTAKEIQAAFSKYLSPENMATVVVGPKL